MKTTLKSSIILMGLLLIIISMSAISAADTDSINQTDDNAILKETQSDHNILSADDDKGTYNELNDEIKKSDEITLNKSYTYDKAIDTGLENGLIINKTVTINGNGYTINSTNLTKLFDITTTGNLTLNNIILISDYGNYSLSNKYRDDATLRNNGILTLNNVTFTTIKEGGGTGTESLGASIYNNGQMTIANSKFINSKINSYTQTSYGLIENNGELTINNTMFDNNYVEISSTYSTIYVNGLICNNKKLTLNQVNITNNRIKTQQSAQGMIKAAGANSEINIYNSLFENNSVNSQANSAHGTAIHAESGIMKIYNSKFIKNTGAFGSGAIRDGAESIYINNTFEKNSARSVGAIYCFKKASIFINNTFIENSAEEDAGALYLAVDTQIDSEHPFANNTFIGNVAGRDGGAIYVAASLGTITYPIENNDFLKNDAKRNGGAILYTTDSGSKYYINNSIFNGNIANNYGIISNYHDSSSELTIQNSIFENNKARSKSGVLIQCRVANFDYNYWGSNNPNFAKFGISSPTNIVIMTINGNETLTNGDIYTINFKDNVSGKIVQLPDFKVNVTSNNNIPTPNSIVIHNGIGIFKLNIEKVGEDIIKVLVDTDEKANKTISVNANIPEFSVSANDVYYGDELDVTFKIISGPEADNYIWTITGINNNMIESGTITKDGKINYTKSYPVGNYTIKVKLENIVGWSDKEVDATFEVKNITNSEENNGTNTNSTPETQNNTNPTGGVPTSQSTITPNQKTASKIIAKNKKFKSKKKVKKYTITLKSGKKAIKNAIVTIKIGKKTYKATTNSKGKATFKIRKLTKKGKYTATIRFAGNGNYKTTAKKVKIIIK